MDKVRPAIPAIIAKEATAVKLLSVVGARPQFIKAAAVSRAISARSGIEEVIVHTGQHYDYGMSEIFFEELQLPRPKYNLNVGSGSHGAQTGAMLARIEEVLLRERPSWILVYGDTNSTLAGALAAVKLHLPVAHIEAGLRSFNRNMPEELNRVLTDHAADLLFAPTTVALANLRAENLGSRAVECGDVMYDAALHYANLAEQRSSFLRRYKLSPKGYCLATVHRAATTSDPNSLAAIFEALEEISSLLPVILTMHPRTRDALREYGIQLRHDSSLKIIEPLGYLDMIIAEKNARLIATDSGGVQKEAYFYQVPCVTLRDESEWVELVQHGFAYLGGTQPSSVLAAVERALAATLEWSTRLYGNGNASEVILYDVLARTNRATSVVAVGSGQVCPATSPL